VRRPAGEGGAAAVEFALVLPLLLLVVFGIVDFGRMLNQQIMLTEAAREIARPVSLRQPPAEIAAATTAALTGFSGAAPAVSAPACPSGAGTTVTVTVTKAFEFATPVGAIADLLGPSTLGEDFTMTGTGAMRCL
jgi:Flp pilus assembly protein TadG